MYLSSVSSDSTGVAILFNGKLDFHVLSEKGMFQAISGCLK